MSRLKTIKPKLQPDSTQRMATSSWRDIKTSSERGYGYKWQQARAVYLQTNPLCCYCQAKGMTTAATVVDHIKPHRGDKILFWDVSNWQPLCATCHSKDKQREEASSID